MSLALLAVICGLKVHSIAISCPRLENRMESGSNCSTQQNSRTEKKRWLVRTKGVGVGANAKAKKRGRRVSNLVIRPFSTS